MQIAFQQRRQQIVGDCRQLKLDVESFNENRCLDNPIQVVFDLAQPSRVLGSASSAERPA